MSWLKHHLFSLGDRQLLSDGVNQYNYTDLHHQINIYMSDLDTHLKPGEVVAMLADYNFHAVALFLALLEKKVIIVPIVSQNPLEINKRLHVAGCTVTAHINDGILKLTRNNNWSIRLNTI